MAGTPWTDTKQHAKAVELYVDHNMATSAIGERFRVSQDQVVRVLKAAGVEIVPGRKRYDGCGGVVGSHRSNRGRGGAYA